MLMRSFLRLPVLGLFVGELLAGARGEQSALTRTKQLRIRHSR